SLKPFVELALLEEIGAAADAACSELERMTATLSLGGGAPGEGLALYFLALQEIEHTDWQQLFEEANRTEKILRDDPPGVYPKMDRESRDLYRKVVLQLAANSAFTETEIAATAVNLAREARAMPGEDSRLFERRNHVGYYLVDDGRKFLEARVGYRPPFFKRIERALLTCPETSYILGIEFVTMGIIAFILSGLHLIVPSLAAIALLLLPAMESAVRIINQLVSFLIQPSRLAKLDFSDGIPSDCATLVVVPTLLLSKQQVREAVEDLEIRHLANADANLHFALLTDLPDSTRPLDEKEGLAGLCTELIQELNKKYQGQQKGSFFLFHRRHLYNHAEGVWMGWERKRGKLLDMNRMLRGEDSDNFSVKVGDLSVLPQIRYVITLDSDTGLPRDSAQRLVGTLAHPLNRAVIDPRTNTVVKGYGILQPRVGVSVRSVTRSRLANIYSGQAGLDLYTRAISDVYQDLFGEGSFAGKGIYEVDVYQQVLDQRFPCNALLSHDLIEGSYARAGLVSDIEVIDDYPSHFSAYSRRKHRWVRGDWQILRWLCARVPGFSGKPVPNVLSFVSRWKILDNLRRSLTEAAILALLIGGWTFLPGGALYWTLATLILVLLPSYLQLFLSLALASGSENWAGSIREAVRGFVTEQVNVLFTLVFLFHQAIVTLDAVFRTLIRLMVTHKRLLEWETSAQAELNPRKKTPVETSLNLTVWLSVTLGAALACFRPRSFPEALPFLLAWACSKPICKWLDRPLPRVRSSISSRDELVLRNLALLTWRFFREWSHAGTNWLIPDHVQESPLLVSNAVSPTNLGFLLASRLAAFDLGYLTVEEFVGESEKTLSAALKLPRFKGHFYNWNNCETLQPFGEPFVSTVDSGNLAACLWALRQGCIEIANAPLFHKPLWQGLRNHLRLLQSLAGEAPASRSATCVMEEMQERFMSMGEDPSAWIASLAQLEQKAEELEAKLLEDDAISRQDEKLWWAAELRVRLASVKRMAQEFTPWLLPEHESVFHYPNVLPIIDPANVTLRALPQLLADIESRLQHLVENANDDLQIRFQARSAIEAIRVAIDNVQRLAETLRNLAETLESLVAEMDFRFLYNPARKLLSIGYNVKAGRLEQACYDLLASESRTAVFVAIAKGDIQQESWFKLGRTHTLFQGERILLSWSGTMFEYLMPALWMHSYPDTILGRSQQAAVRCHQKFGRKERRPWGVSEAAYSKKDEIGHYHYQAFGVPGVALDPEISGNVVAPYASTLALQVDPEAAIQNLRQMERMGWLGAYGFYEASDYQPSRRSERAKHELVRSWMAHHEGMILLALCNALTEASFQRRFHAEPRVQATELILH
ncbi:MAG TPA: glucoamylase family protein, partial [Terriglobia bacterium]|nr:glucoamylase family protein [Terriglobia bacterium]